MVSLNNRFLSFVLILDVFLFTLGLIIPADMGFSSNGNYTDLPNSSITSNSSMIDTVSTGWDSIWDFFNYIIFGGVIGVADAPEYIEIPLLAFFWIINVLAIAEIVSWARELIGFT